MNSKIPGIISIAFMAVAITAAAWYLMITVPPAGVAFIISIPVVFLNLLYFYCRKCPHVSDNSCRHVIFGHIVKKVFTPIPSSPYSFGEIAAALLPLILVFVFPQYWLFQNKFVFSLFWVLMGTAFVIVRAGVCPSCRNVNCTFCPEKKLH